MLTEKFRLKARIRKSKSDINSKVKDFFGWVKGAEIIELHECNTNEDPVRPELDNEFRTSFTNEIPKSVRELDLLSKDAFLQSANRDQKVGRIAIAYTVWSKKKGGGKLIVKEIYKKIKKTNHLNRLVTLSPLTEMAKKFHLRNKAKLIQINETTQNFEYL